MKFDAFGTTKHGKGKSLSKKYFAILISTLGKFNRAIKKSVVYTLRIVCDLHKVAQLSTSIQEINAVRILNLELLV